MEEATVGGEEHLKRHSGGLRWQQPTPVFLPGGSPGAQEPGGL